MLYKCVCLFFFFFFLNFNFVCKCKKCFNKNKKKTCKFYDFTSVGAFLPKIYKLVSFVFFLYFIADLQPSYEMSLDNSVKSIDGSSYGK